ncbi:MAG: transglycosylase domain-containing protein [Ruminococcus sp.]|uniref:transglycosylase domain-containing protein n=1 Tax=Ruminococcus sp. TaxID=41978 RepID=UPI0025FD097C|nr:transglycosylase domain-containing protein [Ruminococcus sp.]MBO4865894.1 transglycosylase domain-containing protein [Ruminococcus sp.]
MEQKRRNKTKHRRRGTHPVVHILKAMGTLLLSIFLIIIITLSIFGTVLTIYVLNFADTTTDIMLEKNVESNITRFLYDNPDYDEDTDDPKDKYVLYYTMRNEYKHQLWVDLDQIPQVVQDAFVYTEDERFYAHDGVDFKSTFAAFVNAFLPNRSKRGGSTITQQTIKNLTGDDAASGVQGIERKIREVFRAINVEKNYTKEDILQTYLNVVPQGTQKYDIIGVQSAANFYFGKDVSELDLAEAACLAGMNNAPAWNNPIDNIKNNDIRRQHCLERMLVNGAISSQEYNDALNEPLELAGNFDYSSETVYDGELEEQGMTDWYLDAAILEARERIASERGISIDEAAEKISNGGYTIYTCVDIDMQHEIEKKMQDASNFTTWYMDPEDDTLWSAFVCMDYKGNVKAVCSSRSEKDEMLGWNQAVNGERSPGSCIKPIASYAPALDQDLITMTSAYNDKPIKLNGKDWPVNYSEFDATQGNWSYKNFYTYQMLLKSLNTMPAQLIDQLTPSYSYNFLKTKLDITNLLDTDNDYAPLTVGAFGYGLHLDELVGAYMIFGNGGRKYEKSYIYKIEDAAGKVVYEKTDGYKQAISDSTAYIMNRMMQYVINDKEGTGRYAKLKKTDLVGKTGTSESWNDLNFVGCTPDYVSGIWIGYEELETIPTNDYQNIGAIWKNIFGDIADSEPHKSFDDEGCFPMPDTVVKLNFCTSTGLIATDRCASQQVGYFKASNVPDYCYH